MANSIAFTLKFLSSLLKGCLCSWKTVFYFQFLLFSFRAKNSVKGAFPYILFNVTRDVTLCQQKAVVAGIQHGEDQVQWHKCLFHVSIEIWDKGSYLRDKPQIYTIGKSVVFFFFKESGVCPEMSWMFIDPLAWSSTSLDILLHALSLFSPSFPFFLSHSQREFDLFDIFIWFIKWNSGVKFINLPLNWIYQSATLKFSS